MGKKKLNRDLALKVLEVAGAVKDALDDLLDTMFIIYQPKDYIGAIGTQAVFTVVAMNVVSYQWQKSDDGVTWVTAVGTGVQTPTFSFGIAQSSYSRKWRCALTDADSNVIYSDVVGLIAP